MRVEQQPFFYSYRYSSLPLPVPKPVPPQAVLFTLQREGLHTFLGRIQGRTKHAAPPNALIHGIGVAPHWLRDTRPVRLFRSLAGSQAQTETDVKNVFSTTEIGAI